MQYNNLMRLVGRYLEQTEMVDWRVMTVEKRSAKFSFDYICIWRGDVMRVIKWNAFVILLTGWCYVVVDWMRGHVVISPLLENCWHWLNDSL